MQQDFVIFLYANILRIYVKVYTTVKFAVSKTFYVLRQNSIDWCLVQTHSQETIVCKLD